MISPPDYTAEHSAERAGEKERKQTKNSEKTTDTTQKSLHSLRRHYPNQVQWVFLRQNATPATTKTLGLPCKISHFVRVQISVDSEKQQKMKAQQNSHM